ncbi:MAG: MlaD family protein [Pseudomonadota bacterium]
METRANFALIGALVLLAAITLAGFVLWLSQSQFNRDYRLYDMVFDGPVALENGASVRFNGIKVGEVQRVAIDRNDDSKVRARVTIDAETPVRVDSVARIDFAGITGTTFVQIQAGAPGAPRLERRPGEAIPIIATEPNPLTTIFAGSSDIVTSAQTTVAGLNALLSPENIDSVSKTLDNIESISAEIARADGLLTKLEATLENLETASGKFGEATDAFVSLSGETESQIEAIGAEAQTLLTDLQETAANADRLLASGESTADSARAAIDGPTVAALEEVRLLAQDVRVLAVRLNGAIRSLEENPQSLLVGDPLPLE